MSAYCISIHDPIVITGIGAIASIGHDRETLWQALSRGESGVRSLRGLRGIPDDELIGAAVDLPVRPPRRKASMLAEIAAAEALTDACIDWEQVNRERFACSVSSVMGDWTHHREPQSYYDPEATWFHNFFPCTPVYDIATRFGLYGPRLSYSTACASGLIGVLAAVRAIEDGQCDMALAGAGDAIDGLMAAGFRKMRVLAKHADPRQACRPFDSQRNGFVLGEGAAMFVIERASHAMARGAQIYAVIRGGKVFADAHHVTGLATDADVLTDLIGATLDSVDLSPSDIGHVNAHGTGTTQNDLVEMRAIRRAFGSAADDLSVAANKSSLGHLINAAGSIELALTVLAMRDGFAPPTLNLTKPDAECDIDCIPMVGRPDRFQHALKVSVAFGGHLVAIALSRWNDPVTGFSYPDELRRAA